MKKITLEFIWDCKRHWIAKTILSKNNTARGIIIANFKIYYRSIVIKIKWYWHKTDM